MTIEKKPRGRPAGRRKEDDPIVSVRMSLEKQGEVMAYAREAGIETLSEAIRAMVDRSLVAAKRRRGSK